MGRVRIEEVIKRTRRIVVRDGIILADYKPPPRQLFDGPLLVSEEKLARGEVSHQWSGTGRSPREGLGEGVRIVPANLPGRVLVDELRQRRPRLRVPPGSRVGSCEGIGGQSALPDLSRLVGQGSLISWIPGFPPIDQ